MMSHAILWLGVALATRMVGTASFTQFALLVAAAYFIYSPFQRNTLVRRAKRLTTAAKAIRRAL